MEGEAVVGRASRGWRVGNCSGGNRSEVFEHIMLILCCCGNSRRFWAIGLLAPLRALLSRRSNVSIVSLARKCYCNGAVLATLRRRGGGSENVMVGRNFAAAIAQIQFLADGPSVCPTRAGSFDDDGNDGKQKPSHMPKYSMAERLSCDRTNIHQISILRNLTSIILRSLGDWIKYCG